MRKTNANDVRNRLWADWEKWTVETTPAGTFMEYLISVFPNVSSRVLSDGLAYFLFDLKYFKSRPVDSMKHLYGEHALLYDVYGCEKHRFVATTHDDHRYNPYMGVYCPGCNLDTIKLSEYEAYEGLVEGKLLSKQEFDEVLNTSKRHKKYWAKVSRRELFKKLFNYQYLRYRVVKFFKNFQALKCFSK